MNIEIYGTIYNIDNMSTIASSGRYIVFTLSCGEVKNVLTPSESEAKQIMEFIESNIDVVMKFKPKIKEIR